MTELYAAAYVAPISSECRPPPESAGITRAFAEAKASTFPYDIGDDPAFFSARHHLGPIAWGVFRADVRCSIDRGDWMVFFSSQRDLQNLIHYRFVAAHCVEEKLRHTPERRCRRDMGDRYSKRSYSQTGFCKCSSRFTNEQSSTAASPLPQAAR